MKPNKIKVSHECPLDLLEKSLEFNDYDYSLLHLMDIPEYKEFYKKQAKTRYQILDKSAFEYQFIDGGFNLDYFVRVINDIKPSSIIIPDVIGDCYGTIKSFESFPFEKLTYNPEIIGVVQGKTQEELEICAQYMHNNAHKLAVVFHSPAYQLGKDPTFKDKNNMLGRYKFVQKLKTITNKPLHLLGCSLPQEFLLYRDEVDTIDTIDTANPIQFGCLGIKYPEDLEDFMDINSKPNYLMNHNNMKKITENLDMINFNIKKFKELI